jgi:hypothetical protein
MHTVYTTDGLPSEEIRIDDDERREVHHYTYDANNKLIIHHIEIEEEGVSEQFEYTRDDKGRITEEIKFYGEDPGERILYSYGATDNPVSIERFDADGEPESFETIIYNEKYLPTEIKKMDGQRNLTEHSVVEYNEKELPVSKITRNGNGALVSTASFSYNDKDEIIRVTETNSDGVITSDILTTYDERGNVIERVIKDFHSRTLHFSYDDNNNCIEEITLDEHGNMIMKTSYQFNELNQVIEESGYYLDTNRGAKSGNSKSRYEYEYYTEEFISGKT